MIEESRDLGPLRIPARRQPISSIGKRLILFLVLFSSGITVLTTAIQLYRDYTIDLRLIDSQFELTRDSFRNGIAQSVWLLDQPQLITQLDGILRLRDIVWAGLEEPNGDIQFEVGIPPSAGSDSRTADIPLTWVYNEKVVPLGTLKVTASLSGVYERLWAQVWVILVSNGVKTFFVTIFMYYLFRRLVTRHLERIAGFMRGLGEGAPGRNLVLDKKVVSSDRKDEIDDLVVTINDMLDESERSRAETENHRNRLRAILQAVPDAIIAVDPELKVRSFNPAAERIFGWAATEIIGRHIKELVSIPESELDSYASRFFETGYAGPDSPAADDRQISGKHRNGSVIPMKISISRAETSEGKLAVAVVTDISVLRQRETEVEEKNWQIREQLIALQEANDVKRRFIAALSHELRTPLNAIIGFSELLQSNASEKLGEETRTGYLKDITEAGRHLLYLVNGLLDIARIERQGASLESRPIDVPEIIGRSTRLMAPDIARKHQTLNKNVAANIRPALGDETAVQQVVLNLLSNASKFAPEGGLVAVSASMSDDSVQICVEDNGRGIPADRIDDLGKPFVQVSDHWSGSAEGLGLGLAISRLLVEEMGGELVVESEEGAWTRVSFTLPLMAAGAETAS